MRWLVFFLIASSSAVAMMVSNTGQQAQNPVLYGEFVAYERDGDIHVYDLARKSDMLISKGRDPSVFGFIVAFENEGVIHYADVRDDEVKSTEVKGRHPFVLADMITFSTRESDLGVDFSNDGDSDDDILRMFDMETGEVFELNAVGDFPSMNQRAVLMVTKEAQVGVDLNADEDKSDEVMRVLDRDSRKIVNLKIEGGKSVISKSGKAAFVSGGEIVVVDVKAQDIIKTNQKGESASVSGDVVVFEREGELFGYSLSERALARIGMKGRSPSFFDDRLVFVSFEGDLGDLDSDGDADDWVMRLAKQEDADGDDILDFADNCPTLPETSPDSDGDGVGDGCEEVEVPVVEESIEQDAPSLSAEQVEPEEKRLGLLWLLLLIPLLPFFIKRGYKYYKKRQKSFGF